MFKASGVVLGGYSLGHLILIDLGIFSSWGFVKSWAWLYNKDILQKAGDMKFRETLTWLARVNVIMSLAKENRLQADYFSN